MPEQAEDVFDQLEAALFSGGPQRALESLAMALRAAGRHHELFEARLMAARHALGRPVNDRTNLDDLPAPVREPLETAYLDACREVGHAFLQEDRLREAWMYLRPLGEKQAMAAKIAQTPVTAENIDLLIELALQEGLSPALGYELALTHYGTCSAITMFDSVAQGRTRAERDQLAQTLVRHLHRELLTNLQADIARRGEQVSDAAAAETNDIPKLVTDRDWLFTDLNYHVDSSHLAATVRIARLTTDAATLRLACELCEYGRRLAAPYQFASDPPFSQLYVDSTRYFRALLGEDVKSAVEFFHAQAQAAADAGANTAAAEVYVALLAHLGRADDALAASLEFLPAGAPVLDMAPGVWELAAQARAFDRVQLACRERADLLGFAAALVAGAPQAS